MRKSLAAVAVAGVVALTGTVLVPGTAHATVPAPNLTCQGGFATPATGTYNNVLVPSTANGSNFCYLDGATVQGNVTVKAGGAVLIANTSIAKNVVSSSAGTAVGGAGMTWSVVLCHSTVGSRLVVTRSASLVEIGTDDFNNCVGQTPMGNTLNGLTNSITHNRGGVEVESNQVNGNLTVSYNRGFIAAANRDPDAFSNETTAVNNNSDSTHTLRCVGNIPFVDSIGNTFVSVIGQCNP